MNTQLRIVSWNIAGARKMQSFDQFDYSGEDIEYFTECLKQLDPDVVCLQETHMNDRHSTAAEIATLLGLPYIYEVAVSPSHVDNSFNLGNAILSKYELDHINDVTYPYPDFDLYLKNGEPAKVHDKMIQIYSLKNVTIANTQMLPLHVFRENYAEGNGIQLARSIDTLLVQNLTEPVIVCGDFNFNAPRDIYPDAYDKLSLRDALPDVLTRPNKEGAKLTPDHILVSDDIEVIESNVLKVQADHYLCYADVRLS